MLLNEFTDEQADWGVSLYFISLIFYPGMFLIEVREDHILKLVTIFPKLGCW